MIKGILFDFNGTMVFDGPMHKEAWNDFSLTYRKKPISDQELEHMHGQTNKEIIKMLLGDSVDEKRSEQLSKAKEALYRKCSQLDPNYHLVDGLETFLNVLKEKNIPMTICSASIKDNIDFFIEYFQLTRWFRKEDIVYDDGTHLNKITMFQKGANNIHVPLNECLVFEDSLSGISFAQQCHVQRIIAITTPEKIEEYKKLNGVDEIIFDFNNLKYPNLTNL